VAVRNSANENDSNGEDGFHTLRRGGDDANDKQFASYLSAISPHTALQSIKEGYEQRISADPEFLSKSIFEVIIAASTQFLAEVGRRGRQRILPEIDFVVAGVLTAVFGKYYSMWKVARTRESITDGTNDEKGSGVDNAPGTKKWRDRVPTNAFQPTLLDGRTKPTLSSRILAFLVPMPQLFRAGVIAATIGYGLTSLSTRIRAMLLPHQVVVTEPVSVPLAAIYTGLFMAFVSNVRYQLLQGVVEPCMVDGAFIRIEALVDDGGKLRERIAGRIRFSKKLVIILIRWGNGLLGSWIAIGGMRAFGLQKLKE